MCRLYIHGGVYFKIAFGKNNYDKPDLQILCKTERFPVSCFIFSWNGLVIVYMDGEDYQVVSIFFPYSLKKSRILLIGCDFFKTRAAFIGNIASICRVLSRAAFNRVNAGENLLANLTYLFGINRLKTLKKQNADAGSPDLLLKAYLLK